MLFLFYVFDNFLHFFVFIIDKINFVCYNRHKGAIKLIQNNSKIRGKKMNVAVYLRKSRAEENQNTEETLKRHKEQLLKFAAESSYTVTDIYEEVVSGESITNRPQMQALMSAVAEGKYDAVLCMDIDRLGRGSMAEQGLIIETFKDSDTMIITPKKTYDLSEETDELSTEFEAFIARMELKKIKKRMNVGKIKTVSDGFCLAEPSFGYERDYIKGKPTLKVNEEQAKVVKMIFDMYTEERMGCQRIANYLNSLNIKTRKGTAFARTSVRHILTNEIYIGNIIYNRINYTLKDGKKKRKKVNPRSEWIIGKGTFPTFITEEQFRLAGEILKENLTIPKPFEKQPNNPLAGLIICGKCGKNMQKQAYKKKLSDTSLFCPTVGCQRQNRFDYVEQELINKLKEFLATDFNTVTITPSKKRNADRTEIINAEIKKLEHQKNSLHDLLEQGIYDTQTFVKRNKIIAEKLAELNKQLLLQTKPIVREIDYERTKERIRHVLEIYDTASIQDKNTYMKSILEKIVYDKNGFGSKAFEISIYIRYSYK